MRLRVDAGLHDGLCGGRGNSTTAYYVAELLGLLQERRGKWWRCCGDKHGRGTVVARRRLDRVIKTR